MRTLTAKEYQALKDADTLRIGQDVEDVPTPPKPPKPYRKIYNYWIGHKTYFFFFFFFCGGGGGVLKNIEKKLRGGKIG